MSKQTANIATKLSLVSIALLTALSSANAAEAPITEAEEIERIQVTGSSIKRTDMEGALPITTLTAEDIAKTGVTSVPDLIQQIPAMQGFTVGAQSVGGGSGGASTASLRDLGSSYTLVLLNGRRMASRNSSGSVDISSIPLAAIKRVEVLTDGASALYGSDAIAGVINFITKNDFTGVELAARVDAVQDGGGDSANFDLTAGIGDLGSDGWNVMATYSHAEQNQLKSSERDFANTGIVPFTYDGTELFLKRASSNAIPANLYLRFNDGVNGGSKSYNPYRDANNGECADKNAPSGGTCLYDFTEMVEIFPESASDNFFLSGTFEVNDNVQAYTDVMFSQTEMTTRIAAKTVSNYQFPLDSAFVTDRLQPMLSEAEYDSLSRVRIKWRARPAGSRTTHYETDTLNLTAGLRGDIGDVSYNLAFTGASSTRDQSRIAGYVLADEFGALLESGTVDVFTTPDMLSPEVNASVAATNYNGLWHTTDTTANSIEGTASAPVFELPAGEVYIGAGFDYRQNSYKRTISEANRQELLYSYSADAEFDLERDTFGLFVEAIAPITDTLEVTAALRYDNIGGITDSMLDSGEQSVTDDMTDTTYKLNASWRPNDDWIVRASVGTGFKAPSMRELASPKVESGFTSGSYDCPISDPADSLYQYCYDEPTQYREAVRGYSELQPETSDQASIGFVYSPSNDFSVSIDWWQINMENQVRELEESQVMNDPDSFRHMFGTRLNTQSGEPEIEVTFTPVNIGESRNQGIDWMVTAGHEFDFGSLKSTIRGAYMLESEYLRVGNDGIWDTSLGKFGPNSAVTFPHIIKINNSFTHGDFVHSLNMNYKSGYEDQTYAAGSSRISLQSDLTQTYDADVERDVASYITWNYVAQWNAMTDMSLSFGIKNMFDRAPPFSLRTAGGGHQVGYDPRYVDQLGRTFYVKGSYTF